MAGVRRSAGTVLSLIVYSIYFFLICCGWSLKIVEVRWTRLKFSKSLMSVTLFLSFSFLVSVRCNRDVSLQRVFDSGDLYYFRRNFRLSTGDWMFGQNPSVHKANITSWVRFVETETQIRFCMPLRLLLMMQVSPIHLDFFCEKLQNIHKGNQPENIEAMTNRHRQIEGRQSTTLLFLLRRILRLVTCRLTVSKKSRIRFWVNDKGNRQDNLVFIGYRLERTSKSLFFRRTLIRNDWYQIVDCSEMLTKSLGLVIRCANWSLYNEKIATHNFRIRRSITEEENNGSSNLLANKALKQASSTSLLSFIIFNIWCIILLM